ncbi:hypothetical protein LOK49_LG03G01635 [Camellia lanceoleosa]|uniref:Uncharacterized protein n=1 Tax=Camellia lanceoleosa TaxID=1840588 RepID=A0ACC0I8G0_9ERIC|nr:hypothetical protein LOK49_LG03G01635 [Camellia lanceoleosa]
MPNSLADELSTITKSLKPQHKNPENNSNCNQHQTLESQPVGAPNRERGTNYKDHDLGDDCCDGERDEGVEEGFDGGGEFDGSTVEAVVGAVGDCANCAKREDGDEEGEDEEESQGLEIVIGDLCWVGCERRIRMCLGWD